MNFALLAAAPLMIQIHVAAAIGALALGAVQLAAPKGRLPHRLMGWVWIGLMSATALSALFITELNGDAFSLIHGLIPITLIGLTAAMLAVRRKNIRSHRSGMMWMFFAALLIPGAMAMIPGRLMWSVLVGA